MARFDVGGGWGARSVRPVVIFQDQKKFEDFIDGVTVASQVDEITGLTSVVVLDAAQRSSEYRPTAKLIVRDLHDCPLVTNLGLSDRITSASLFPVLVLR